MSTYAARVKRGRSLVEREAKGIRDVAALRFQLGDEVLAVRAEAEYGDASVERYAIEIGLSQESAKHYAAVAQAFPEKGYRGTPSLREFNASYTVFRELAGRDDRGQVIAKLRRRKPEGRYWTADEVRAELGRELKRQAMPTPREVIASASIEEKARIVQQIAKESPEAIKDAASDLTTRVAIAKGTAAYVNEADAAREQRERKSHGFQKTAEVEAEVALYNAKSSVEKAAKELSRIDGPPSAEAKVSIARIANKIRDQLDTIITFLEGDSSFDEDALAAFLEE